ncbi:MAG TPA: FAD-dependent oxidoreductase [Syntrophomonadaceae bacterium]|nr:FAD-dependent oxidoreductase [Syntrophomonadaceae bacterium]
MGKKVLIIGGVAAGASAAARLRRMDENAEIIMFERGEYISFANCGLPYFVGGVINKRNSLLVQTPRSMKNRFAIDVRIRQEVKRILAAENKVVVFDYVKNEEYQESYDYLVLCPGSTPIMPDLPGISLPNVFQVRNVPDSDIIKAYIETHQPSDAVVIGGGFIGLEMAEMLQAAGLKVHLVEAGSQVMQPLDPEMAAFLHRHLREKEVDLHLVSRVVALEGEDLAQVVRLENGQLITTDLVVMGMGVRPETDLAREAGLEIGAKGILVNEYLQTSDPHIYAAGDAIQVQDLISGEAAWLPLAGPANRQGWVVANNIAGTPRKFRGTQGTSIVKVMDMVAATTGQNAKNLTRLGVDFLSCHVHPFSHATYYPGARQMCIKLLFTPGEGRVLGAQIVGSEGVDKRIDVLATAIRSGLSVFDLQELELAYAPPFSSAKDPVNMTAYVAGNILDHQVEVVYWQDVPVKVQQGAFLIDARTPSETTSGMAEGAYNLPVDEIRNRLDEIPKDREILIYCQVGLRSYVASRILKQRGYRVKNISGGYRLYDALTHQ